MRENDTDRLFAKVRMASSPTDADRARLRARLAKQISTGAAASVAATVAKAATGQGASKVAAASAWSAGLAAKVAVGVAVVVLGSGGFVAATRRAPLSSLGPPRSGQRSSQGSLTGPSTRSSQGDAPASLVPPLPAVTAHADPFAPAREVAVSDPQGTQAIPPSARTHEAKDLGAPSQPRETTEVDAPSTHTLEVRDVIAPALRAPPIESTRAQVDPPPARTPSKAEQVRGFDAEAPLVQTSEVRQPADPSEEIALVGEMQAALRDHDVARVLAAVAEHKRRFPHGALVEEREGARVLALCEGGAPSRTALGDEFLALYPRSTLGVRVRAACGARRD